MSTEARDRHLELIFASMIGLTPAARRAAFEEYPAAASQENRLTTAERAAIERRLEEHDAGARVLENLVATAEVRLHARGGGDQGGGLPADPWPSSVESNSRPWAYGRLDGRRIGQYTLQQPIGSGSFGDVYLAMQDRPRRPVAIKLAQHFSPAQIKRFEYEAQTLARLEHPAISRLYEFGFDDSVRPPRPYVAIEYVRDAHTIIEDADRRKLDLRQRLGVFHRVVDGVALAHQRGIIHRDLKPANILVDADGNPKVIDFGLARATDSDLAAATLQTEAGPLGTLRYMAPEQFDGNPHALDIRCDVYSLGVVLYELLCGAPPYEFPPAAGVAQIAAIVRDLPPKRPSQFDLRLRGDLETILLKALEKERSRRYSSAHELAADIRRHLDGDSILARPPSVLHQLRSITRRHRVAAAATIGAVASITAAAIGFGYGFSKEVDLRRQANQALEGAEKDRDAKEAALRSAHAETDRARTAESDAKNAEGVAASESARRVRLAAVASLSHVSTATEHGGTRDPQVLSSLLDLCFSIPPEERDWHWNSLVGGMVPVICRVDLGTVPLALRWTDDATTIRVLGSDLAWRTIDPLTGKEQARDRSLQRVVLGQDASDASCVETFAGTAINLVDGMPTPAVLAIQRAVDDAWRQAGLSAATVEGSLVTPLCDGGLIIWGFPDRSGLEVVSLTEAGATYRYLGDSHANMMSGIPLMGCARGRILWHGDDGVISGRDLTGTTPDVHFRPSMSTRAMAATQMNHVSPHGRRVIGKVEDGRSGVWNLQTGDLIAWLEATSVGVSSDEDVIWGWSQNERWIAAGRMAAATSRNITVWDAFTGGQVLDEPLPSDGLITAMVVGDKLPSIAVILGDKSLPRLLVLSQEAEERRWLQMPVPAAQGWDRLFGAAACDPHAQVALAPVGELLAMADQTDLTILRLDSAERHRTLAGSEQVQPIKKGRIVQRFGDRCVVADDECATVTATLPRRVRLCASDRAGRRLAIVEHMATGVELWDLHVGESMLIIGEPGLIPEKLWLHPRGDLLIVGYSRFADLWDLRPMASGGPPVRQGRMPADLPAHCAFDPSDDTLRLLDEAGRERVWQGNTWTTEPFAAEHLHLGQYLLPGMMQGGGGTYCLVSDSGKTMIATCNQITVAIQRDSPNPPIFMFNPAGAEIRPLCVDHADRKLIAAVAGERMLHAWDLATGVWIGPIERFAAPSADSTTFQAIQAGFSPDDGSRLFVSTNGQDAWSLDCRDEATRMHVASVMRTRDGQASILANRMGGVAASPGEALHRFEQAILDRTMTGADPLVENAARIMLLEEVFKSQAASIDRVRPQVKKLLDDLVFESDVVAALEQDQGLSADDRQNALRLARIQGDSISRLLEAGWGFAWVVPSVGSQQAASTASDPVATGRRIARVTLLLADRHEQCRQEARQAIPGRRFDPGPETKLDPAFLRAVALAAIMELRGNDPAAALQLIEERQERFSSFSPKDFPWWSAVSAVRCLALQGLGRVEEARELASVINADAAGDARRIIDEAQAPFAGPPVPTEVEP